MKLNSEQQAAVTYIDGPLMIIAGAGSGKTRVITEKIAYLISVCQFKPHEIMAITFTKKAAKEMAERLSLRVGSDIASSVAISTFHALGLRFLSEEKKHFQWWRGVTLFDEDDCDTILQGLCVQYGLKPENKKLIHYQIDQWKNQMISPEQALTLAGTKRVYAKIYSDFQQQLQAYHAVDFSDLIGLPVKLLASNAEVREKWQNRIRYLLVDEYQDTNEAQYQWLIHLTGVRGRITVVGDDDQSIYTWRGARPENLHQLQKDFPQLKVIKLEQNYRSTKTILQAANTLIQNNEHLFEKKLWSELPPGEKIRVIKMEDDAEEARQVVSELLSEKLKNKRNYADFAILYRSNHQAKLIESALLQSKIPYQITGGGSFFAKREIKDVLAYCRLVVNQHDDPAFLRIINVPRRGIGIQSLEKLSVIAKKSELSLLACCEKIGHLSEFSPLIQKKFQQFFTRMREMQQKMQKDPLAAIEALLSDVGYRAWLIENENKEVAEKRWLNIRELLSWFDADLKNSDFAEIINRLQLEKRDEAAQEQKVQLMTLHAAKGLEFPVVFLIGVEENTLPHANAIAEDNIAEERRLAYVGITRAREKLLMTLAGTRQVHGQRRSVEQSRFIDELPEDLVIKSGFSDSQSQEPKTVQSHLNTLRDLLKQQETAS